MKAYYVKLKSVKQLKTCLTWVQILYSGTPHVALHASVWVKHPKQFGRFRPPFLTCWASTCWTYWYFSAYAPWRQKHQAPVRYRASTSYRRPFFFLSLSEQFLVLHPIGILENMDMNMNIHEYVTHRIVEHDFNILLQGGESGQLPLLDSTFEGIPQN